MKTKIISILFLLCTFSAFSQKKEIKNAKKAVEEGKYEEAKSLLKQVENSYKNEKENLQSTYLITKGKAFLGDVSSLDTPLEDLKVSAQAFLEAKNLGVDKTASNEGMQNLKAKLVNSAIEDQNKEKFMVAATKLSEAYNISKVDTVYLYFAASSAVNGKDYEMALDYYNKLLDLNFDGSEVSFQATNVSTNEVETFSNKILRDASVKSGSHIKPVDKKSASKKAEITKNMSLIYIQQEKPELAKKALKKALEISPNDVSLMQAEADLYYNLGDIKKYNEIMSKISEMSPDDPIVYFNLGVSSEKLNDFKRAKEFYEKAIEIKPDMSDAYYSIAAILLKDDTKITEEMNNLGMSAADSKKYDELKVKKIEIIKSAVPYLKKSIELDDTKVSAMKVLKSIYYQTGENDKASEMDAMIKAKE